MSFSDMKQRSKTNLASLIKETEKISNPNSFGDVDDRYWRQHHRMNLGLRFSLSL